ncbi:MULTISPECIES: hypothetical protein [unclassified Mesorhizobium]|uniref:hypothetical protein n=1 Tax=unclassified Mesorhizobium TaxID=325217 RepID=UPI000FE5ADDE|nr:MULTISPECIES: hypothetical protein [unclassified Mesorhizobium]RWC23862.1 MAG: hypothetical protein EOS51_05975 [Mesorhizobium sp.]RWD21399.1 MAG: hypothetical protein EOS57_06245 [Mesorhizobium sp.]RWE65850.1 MAG: hypothetical protein EOS62_23005 [Mesorhizobium sp.]
MLPKARVEHTMSGRLRVRVSDFRGDVSYFRSAIDKLSNYPEIAGLRANPMTGSFIIVHKTDLPSIRKIAADCEVFDLQETSSPPPRQGPPPPRGNMADDRTLALEGDIATVIGLLGLAAYQATRGHGLGPATENFWNAFGALRILKNPYIALVFGGLGILQLTTGRWAGSASSLLFYAFVVRQLSGSSPEMQAPANRTNRNPKTL